MDKFAGTLVAVAIAVIVFEHPALVIVPVLVGGVLIGGYLAAPSGDAIPILQVLAEVAGVVVVLGVGVSLVFSVLQAAYIAASRHVNAEADIAKAWHRQQAEDGDR